MTAEEQRYRKILEQLEHQHEMLHGLAWMVRKFLKRGDIDPAEQAEIDALTQKLGTSSDALEKAKNAVDQGMK